MAAYKPICYYVMNNGCMEEKNALFERPDEDIKSHLKPLFITRKIEDVPINKILVDCDTTVNLILHHILRKIAKYDTDAKPHNMVLSNYEGNVGFTLGVIQVKLTVGTVTRSIIFMIVETKERQELDPQVGEANLVLMIEFEALKRISAYITENKQQSALEAEVKNMVVEASKEFHQIGPGKDFVPEPPDKVQNKDQGQRLDAIYDDEPLGFDRSSPVVKEVKDYFAWDYDEMPGLSKDLVELKLPIKPGKKHIKQNPRQFALAILSKIKEEVERLLRSNFIRTARYVKWLANIVPVIKNNGTLRVCIDFRDLNTATPKDEYSMPVAEMLVNSVVGHEYLSMLDGYSGYNQIFIAEEDVPKTEFRCSGALSTYE
ncbi:uncharacterized protein LOC127101860 [Lathyrus oleraceus]|uniref:uncharacterized protein LOC127101860 n=1 Tax=Pisum sativum TaxID=3888 RepID=UPI0021D155CF|nr:uncharacterized protein LOC127101860 [Pisum sativum]